MQSSMISIHGVYDMKNCLEYGTVAIHEQKRWERGSACRPSLEKTLPACITESQCVKLGLYPNTHFVGTNTICELLIKFLLNSLHK